MTATKIANPCQIFLVDDHPTVREGLAWRISQIPHLKVCGEADDIPEALRLIEELKPDVVIIDIGLKTGSGLDLIKQIRATNERVRLLVWSMYDESLYADRALRAGALGFVNKEEATDKVIEAIDKVMSGDIWLSDTMTSRILKRTVGSYGGEVKLSPVDVLTDRELQVLHLVGQGLKAAEIAARLNLSIKTIETYRDRLRRKLDLSHGTKLTHFATQWVINQGQPAGRQSRE